MEQWTPKSWRHRHAHQQPVYPDAEKLETTLERIRQLPPLVAIGEVKALRQQLAEAALGRRFVLQGGDCAERFHDCNSLQIMRKLKILLQMSLVISYGARQPVVNIGRVAGQFAKPRSKDTERVDGEELPVFRGDSINGIAATAESRRADPHRLEWAYFYSASTMNFIRALLEGGFANLSAPEHWQLDWVPQPTRNQYAAIAERVRDVIDYFQRIGALDSRARALEVFSSHEGLLLPYEEALTRRFRSGGAHYNLGAHFLWIGERTRQLDGAHVEYFRGIANPIGVKLGPTCPPDELLALLERLDPKREPGRVTLITRYGASLIEKHLPAHLRAVRKAGLQPVWMCDPMHGNTTTQGRVKTRDFGDILSELTQAFDIHGAEGGLLNGVHFELTGENVTECTGGSDRVASEDLERSYLTGCDPRLNYTQSLEMAFLLSSLIQRDREGVEPTGFFWPAGGKPSTPSSD